jgi:predicted DCC family thiol-disulfide oxidoreductase YuxK
LLILSAGGVAIEFLLASQVLFRGKVLEFVQTVGFLFHILLVFMLGEDLRNSFQILLFSCAAIAIYPICNQKYWTTNSPIIFWDASCSFCGKSINLFKKLDVTENFKYLSNSEVSKYKDAPFDQKIIEETIVVWDQHSDKYWIKSKAIMYILTENYFLWFAKPLIYLPFIYKYTDRMYDRVALTRSCNI